MKVLVIALFLFPNFSFAKVKNNPCKSIEKIQTALTKNAKNQKAISSYATILLMLANRCPKQMITSVGFDRLFVKYKVGSIKTDNFKINKDNQVVSWIRKDSNGKSKTFTY